MVGDTGGPLEWEDMTPYCTTIKDTHLFSKDLTRFTWYDVVLCSKS